MFKKVFSGFMGAMLVVLFVAIGGTTAEAKTVMLKIAHANVAKHPMGVGFEKFKEMVESRSNGEVKVKIFDSGKFGGVKEMMSAIQTNTLQMVSIPTPYLVNYDKKFAIFDMPFLFPSYEATDKITDGSIGTDLAGILEKRDMKGLGYIEIGFRNIFNNKKAVKTLEDARGLKIRATGSKAHIATLQSFGILATSVAWGEVYTAMQQKTVDGIDIDINLAAFNKFYEVNNYLTLTRSLYTPHLVFINNTFLKKLTPENQKIVLAAFEEMKVFERDLNRRLEEEGIQKLKAGGIEVTTLSPQERQRWVDASASVYKKFEDTIGKDLIAEVKRIVNP